MSKGWHEWADRFHGCPKFPGKNRYADRGVAMAAARKGQERFSGNPPLRAYACKACKGWHLTHKEQR